MTPAACPECGNKELEYFPDAPARYICRLAEAHRGHMVVVRFASDRSLYESESGTPIGKGVEA